MSLQTTTSRLWKNLPPEERLAATTAFFSEPSPEVMGMALGAIVRARHMRPQAARALPPEAQARILATVLEPGETLASSLLVALHLAERRPLLGAFLDAVGLPHENGILKDEDDGAPLEESRLRKGVAALADFPAPQVETYLNTLWLQDPERWAGVPAVIGKGYDPQS
jgi:hypothetical protein